MDSIPDAPMFHKPAKRPRLVAPNACPSAAPVVSTECSSPASGLLTPVQPAPETNTVSFALHFTATNKHMLAVNTGLTAYNVDI